MLKKCLCCCLWCALCVVVAVHVLALVGVNCPYIAEFCPFVEAVN